MVSDSSRNDTVTCHRLNPSSRSTPMSRMRWAIEANIVVIIPNTPPIAMTTATITTAVRKKLFVLVSSA